MEIASSQVISSTRNSDLGRCSSIKPPSVSEIHLPQNSAKNITSNSAANRSQFHKNSPPMTVDGILRNMYGEIPISDTSFLDADINLIDPTASFPIDNPQSIPLPPSIAHKSVEDVWKEIVNGESERKECKQEVSDEMMTLEDFLAKAGAMEEDDVKVSEKVSGGIFAFDHLPPSPYQTQQAEVSVLGFPNGVETSGRCKRKALLEPLDKAAQQRQRRMIKNRESAARSRERKQAYQFELESLAAKLEEENAQLMKEKEERRRERLKQLMENVIPVLEKRRPPRILRRSNSLDW